MIKKWIIWFLVLTFLNFVIVPDYVFAGGGSFDIGPIGPSGGEAAAVAVVVVVFGLIIVGIALLAKHSKSSTPTKEPQEQKEGTGISPITNLDEQLITPSGQIALLRW